MKETLSRARRLTREMLIYWKRFDKVEKEHRKRAEKEAQEQRKLDLELMEVGSSQHFLTLHLRVGHCRFCG
jgi:DNA helicase INO80